MRTLAESPSSFKTPAENSSPEYRRINPIPFLPVPVAALHDRRLTAADRDVLAALLEAARNEPDCRPANADLAAAVGRCVRSVQVSLARLQECGWVRVELRAWGRRVSLCWREGAHQVSPPVQPAAPPVVQPASPPVQVSTPPVVKPGAPVLLEEDKINERDVAGTRPIEEELRGLPGVGQAKVRGIAQRLAAALHDHGSVAFFIGVLGQVASGIVPVERLLTAFKAGSRAVGHANRPGAVFTRTYLDWTPPPKPSEINRPTYHRAAPRAPVEVPRDPADEVAELRAWLAQPRHPFAGFARRRLAALGLE